jgi:hypothetical protein
MHILVVEHDAQLVQQVLIRRGGLREAIFYDDADRELTQGLSLLSTLRD